MTLFLTLLSLLFNLSFTPLSIEHENLLELDIDLKGSPLLVDLVIVGIASIVLAGNDKGGTLNY